MIGDVTGAADRVCYLGTASIDRSDVDLLGNRDRVFYLDANKTSE